MVLVWPMFSRGANQAHAELRLTEFKSLMRLWWRRWWWGSQETPTVGDLRTNEAGLFGGPASPAGDPVASNIRMRAVDVNLRSTPLKEIFGNRSPANAQGARQKSKSPLQAASYLAYGWNQSAGEIANARPLQGSFTVRFEFPADDEYERSLLTVLWLIDQFGTLGSRAANGWGSLRVTELSGSHPGTDGGPIALVAPERTQLLRDPRASDGWPSGLIGLHEVAVGGQVRASDPRDALMVLHDVRRSIAEIKNRKSTRSGSPRQVNALRLRVDTDLSPDGSTRPGQPWFARWYLTGPSDLVTKDVNDALFGDGRPSRQARNKPPAAEWQAEPWDPWGSSGGD